MSWAAVRARPQACADFHGRRSPSAVPRRPSFSVRLAQQPGNGCSPVRTAVSPPSAAESWIHRPRAAPPASACGPDMCGGGSWRPNAHLHAARVSTGVGRARRSGSVLAVPLAIARTPRRMHLTCGSVARDAALGRFGLGFGNRLTGHGCDTSPPFRARTSHKSRAPRSISVASSCTSSPSSQPQ